MIRHLDNWLAAYRTPFWEAIYLNRESQCQDSLDNAQKALDSAPFSEDENRALGIYLQFLRYQLRHYFSATDSDRADIVRGEIVSTTPSGQGPLAGIMQARCSLTQRCWAHAMHGIGLPRAHVDRFYAQIPEDDRDHQMMNYLSFWAFANADLVYMEQSYRFFLLEPVEFMVDFSRQRVKVMQAVIRKDLERTDLLRLFELMPHRMHAAWFEQLLLPALEEHRLIAAETRELFMIRKRELEASEPQIPPRTQKAGKITLNF